MMQYRDRKHPRLKHYDYSQNGYYHVIIQTFQNQNILSSIGYQKISDPIYADTIYVKLTKIGMVCKEQLFALEQRFTHIKIDKYVIMPTHIHAIIILQKQEENETLMDVICAYKSLVTRICNENDHLQGRKIFQTSFYEEIIRNEIAYQKIWHYIDKNPRKCLET